MPGITTTDAVTRFSSFFGVGERYAEITKEDEARLARRCPEVFRRIVAKDGWCSYKGQVLWLVDPDLWKPATEAWFPDAPDACALARTAFGDLLVFTGQRISFAMPHESTVFPGIAEPDWFFGFSIVQKGFATQAHLPKLVGAAAKAAGKLEPDEMYTYVPALALGGSAATSKIQRVKANEQLDILSKLAPIRHLR